EQPRQTAGAIVFATRPYLLQGGVTLFERAYAMSCPRCSCMCVAVEIQSPRAVLFCPNMSTVVSSCASVVAFIDVRRNANDFSSSAITAAFFIGRFSNASAVL